jgi:hypothetical protein
MAIFQFNHVLTADDGLIDVLTHLVKGTTLNQSLLEKIMLNTANLLAAVAAANTTTDSLIALVQANTAAQQAISAQLTAANASIASLQAQIAAGGGDPAQLAALQAQVADLSGQLTTAQTDLDKATADLSAESAKAQTALNAGSPPVPNLPPVSTVVTSS